MGEIHEHSNMIALHSESIRNFRSIFYKYHDKTIVNASKWFDDFKVLIKKAIKNAIGEIKNIMQSIQITFTCV